MSGTRFAHFLDPTSGTGRPTNVVFFDTETRAEPLDAQTTRQVLKLGVAWHCGTIGDVQLRFRSECIIREPSDFWSWLERVCREKSTTYLVAHNIVFDLTVLSGWRELVERGWRLDSFYTKAVTSIFRWSKGTKRLIGVDNTNLFAGKLAEWGEALGVPKLEVDFATVTDDQLLIYCRRDVEIMVGLWRLWLKFLDDHDCGSFKMTVGSTAFNAWRHRYLKNKVYIHDNPLALRLERESYRGARSECLFQGMATAGPYYYLDINNMYGYVMSRYEFPSELVGAAERVSLSYLLRKLQRYNVIARVALDVSEPLFPYKYQGHVCYPLRQFDTTLTTPELMYAFQRGWIIGIGAMAWYKAVPLFRDYILYWHNLRLQYKRDGQAGLARVCKLLNNSLYGKFGQSGFDQRRIGAVPVEQVYTESVYDLDTHEYYRHIALGGVLYEEKRQGEGYHSFPAIAAHVTAYARLYLASLAGMAGTGNCFYVDTDSLLVNESGKEALSALLSETELGCLKVEKTSPWLEVNAPKDYRMDGRERHKGVSEKAERLSSGVYLQDTWVRLDGMLQRGDVSQYVIRRGEKHLSRKLYSGTLDPLGWVHPFVLAESCLSGALAPERETVQLPQLVSL